MGGGREGEDAPLEPRRGEAGENIPRDASEGGSHGTMQGAYHVVVPVGDGFTERGRG